MRIGIKIGSKMITKGNGKINMIFIANLCRQISQLKDDGHEVFLVTSGAVVSDGDTKRSDLLRASVGQGKLISSYIYHFSMFDYDVAQLVPTYHDLNDSCTDFFKTLNQALADPKTIPVINYNDPMDDRELQQMHNFADNDNLFKTICLLNGVDIPIIGFDKDGISDDKGAIIRTARRTNKNKILNFLGEGSDTGYKGKGEGPVTKVEALFELSAKFGKAILAPGGEKDFVLRAVSGEENFGTIFLD